MKDGMESSTYEAKKLKEAKNSFKYQGDTLSNIRNDYSRMSYQNCNSYSDSGQADLAHKHHHYRVQAAQSNRNFTPAEGAQNLTLLLLAVELKPVGNMC